MSFAKNLVSKTSETFRNLVKKFPVTLAIIVFATLFMVIDIEHDISISDKVILFCFIFAVESFFTEIFFHKKGFKIISHIVSAIISIGFTILILNDIFNAYNEANVSRILAGYLIILFLISIYKIIKENNIDFGKYLLKVFANIFNSTITYLVLNLGLTLITVIFVELLLDSWGHILGRLQILLLGLFYVPALINSVWNVKEKEVNAFIQGLVKFVLLPLVSIAMIIIYMYIIKILVLRQIPSNVIFRILAGIFVVAFPVWNMAESFKDDNKFIGKLAKLLPYFYMPFILLEIYSLYVRISEFGLTPTRYFGIIFIIAQIIALILNVVKKGEKLSSTFIYMAVLALIAFILPLNYSKASILSQKNILVSNFPETSTYEELSTESKEKVSGAYRYLLRNNASKYIPEYISQYKGKFDTEYETINNIRHIYFTCHDTLIDINKYSKLINLSVDQSSTTINYYYNDDLSVSIDLTNYISTVINLETTKGTGGEYIRNNQLVEIDNTKDIYITYLYVSYNVDTREIDYLSINAYVLYK